MSDNKDSVKIQHLIDEAERLPKQEAIVVLRALRSVVAVGVFFLKRRILEFLVEETI